MRPQTARTVAVLAVLAAALYLLRGTLTAVCWSCVIAVSTWPLHDRMQRALRGGSKPLSAAVLTSAAALLLLLPIVYLTIQSLREVPLLLHIWSASNDAGLPAPDWLGRLPFVGDWALKQWNGQIAEPGALHDFAHGLTNRLNLQTGRSLVLELGHRAMSIFFCILVLYFLYLRGDELAAQVHTVIGHHLGRPGVHTLEVAVRAVRGTVNGLVLVGLALAAVMSLAYAIGGIPHAAFWGMATGILGIVPFGAMVALAAVAVYLFAIGATHAALVIGAFGVVLIFVTDHFIRPLFISGASRVPLVLALLGIVGGLETFGVLGLFVGPTLIAIAVAVWRELASAGRKGAPQSTP
jgi:predicted PurR-regulated permease PerM